MKKFVVMLIQSLMNLFDIEASSLAENSLKSESYDDDKIEYTVKTLADGTIETELGDWESRDEAIVRAIKLAYQHNTNVCLKIPNFSTWSRGISLYHGTEPKTIRVIVDGATDPFSALRDYYRAAWGAICADQIDPQIGPHYSDRLTVEELRHYADIRERGEDFLRKQEAERQAS